MSKIKRPLKVDGSKTVPAVKRCEVERPFCACAKSSVLVTAIWDRDNTNGTRVDFGFYCPACGKYYNYWLCTLDYWYACKAIEQTYLVESVKLITSNLETHTHPSAEMKFLLEVVDD